MARFFVQDRSIVARSLARSRRLDLMSHAPQRNKQRQRRRNENNRHLELRREQHPDRHLSVRIEALRVTTPTVGAIIGAVKVLAPLGDCVHD